ncbi:hypothetical protein DVH05_001196 [Phytophthora capsici]|nr:hypothetical protein DVH05_001196 [Phytophthora capsici]
MNTSDSAVLVGESAVMEYAIKSGLLGDNEDGEGNDSNEGNEGNNDDDSKKCNGGDESKDGNDDGEDGEGGMSNDRDEEIRVSQIDNTAQLSQKTLNDLFGSSSDSVVEFSQAAVARAFDLYSTELEQRHDAAQSFQLL